MHRPYAYICILAKARPTMHCICLVEVLESNRQLMEHLRLEFLKKYASFKLYVISTAWCCSCKRVGMPTPTD